MNCLEFRAHSDDLTSIKVIQLDRRYLVSSGRDRHIKIWAFDWDSAKYEMICDLNVNWVLPYVWNLVSGKEKETKLQEKVMFAPVSYTHLRAHETRGNLVCRLLLEKKKK